MGSTLMTKEEYLRWKPQFDAFIEAELPAPPEVSQHCAAADQLIKVEAMMMFKEHIAPLVQSDELREMLTTYFYLSFGSVEIDNYLVKHNLYPDWM